MQRGNFYDHEWGMCEGRGDVNPGHETAVYGYCGEASCAAVGFSGI